MDDLSKGTHISSQEDWLKFALDALTQAVKGRASYKRVAIERNGYSGKIANIRLHWAKSKRFAGRDDSIDYYLTYDRHWEKPTPASTAEDVAEILRIIEDPSGIKRIHICTRFLNTASGKHVFELFDWFLSIDPKSLEFPYAPSFLSECFVVYAKGEPERVDPVEPMNWAEATTILLKSL